jgi:hypothetical protein
METPRMTRLIASTSAGASVMLMLIVPNFGSEPLSVIRAAEERAREQSGAENMEWSWNSSSHESSLCRVYEDGGAVKDAGSKLHAISGSPIGAPASMLTQLMIVS